MYNDSKAGKSLAGLWDEIKTTVSLPPCLKKAAIQNEATEVGRNHILDL